MTNAETLTLRGLSGTALKGCDLSVAPGEIVAIQGPSGSGKSLLLRAIADLDPHEGAAWLGPLDRARMSGPAWRRKVRYVAAEPAWWADRVGDHMRHPERAAALAVSLGLAADCLDWPVTRLSTGEKQRLGLVRALEDDPPVLLLDEPTAALDDAATLAVEALLTRRRDDGVAMVLVTHSDAQAARLADRRLVIHDGCLRNAVS